MDKKILYHKKYLDINTVTEIKQYFDQINDSPYDSRGPQDNARLDLGWSGCWDRQLHYDRIDNPIHDIVAKLKHDFGDFVIYESSIRYFCAPFGPHTDIRDTDWVLDAKKRHLREGYVFLVPLWWHDDYEPATVFYNSPARLCDACYDELDQWLPKFNHQCKLETRHFSVREILHWQQPGDLLTWENFQWHGSAGRYPHVYDRRTWIKEFISIETWRA